MNFFYVYSWSLYGRVLLRGVELSCDTCYNVDIIPLIKKFNRVEVKKIIVTLSLFSSQFLWWCHPDRDHALFILGCFLIDFLVNLFSPSIIWTSTWGFVGLPHQCVYVWERVETSKIVSHWRHQMILRRPIRFINKVTNSSN